MFLLKTLRPAKYRQRAENENINRHVVEVVDSDPPSWLVERAEN